MLRIAWIECFFSPPIYFRMQIRDSKSCLCRSMIKFVKASEPIQIQGNKPSNQMNACNETEHCLFLIQFRIFMLAVLCGILRI